MALRAQSTYFAGKPATLRLSLSYGFFSVNSYIYYKSNGSQGGNNHDDYGKTREKNYKGYGSKFLLPGGIMQVIGT